MADLKERTTGLLNKMDGDLLACANIIGNLDAHRQGADTWGDVGTLTMLSVKIERLRAEIGEYVKRRIPDFPDRYL